MHPTHPIVIAASLAATLALAGCHSAKEEKAAPAAAPVAAAAPGAQDKAGAEKNIPEVTVSTVARILKDKSGTVIDANGDETRKEFGVIPGAVLLSDHKNYALSELPGDKSSKLVFYCGGTQCRASDSAAHRAAENGYVDVSVLRPGIRGWKEAGQPTETPRS